jgi:hypothetical protein
MTGQLKVVTAMLAAAIDVDITSHGEGDDTSMEHTVIFMAAIGGDRRVLVHLLAHTDACGATFDQKRRALYAGPMLGDVRCEPALCQAAMLGHEGVIEVLLESGLSKRDCSDMQGSTALHHACQHGHVGVAKILFAGCTADATREMLFADDDYGRNAFDLAAAEGQPECLDYLLQVAAANQIGLAAVLSRASSYVGTIGWTVFEHASAPPRVMRSAESRTFDAAAAAKIRCVDILLRHPEMVNAPFRRVFDCLPVFVDESDDPPEDSPSVQIGLQSPFALAAEWGHRSSKVLLHLLQLDQYSTSLSLLWDGDADNQRLAMVGAMEVLSRSASEGRSAAQQLDPDLDECLRHLLAAGGSEGVQWHSDARALRVVREMAQDAIDDRRKRIRVVTVEDKLLGASLNTEGTAGWASFLSRAAANT